MEIEYITHSLDATLSMNDPHVMALGFFDGVHLGHQSLLQQAKAIAKKENVKFTVMTFDPHPNEIFKRETDRRYITPPDSKLERISALGADKIFVMNFNFPFASLPADDFIQKYIVGLNAKHVVVGFDFTFGHKAQGDVDYLRHFSKNSSFEVTVISKKTRNNQKISSTLIRKLISDGDVHLIPDYLGKHYEITGSLDSLVESPIQNTAFHIHNKYLMPKPGLYKVEIISGTIGTKGLLRCGGESCHLSSSAWVSLYSGEITIKFLYQAALMRTVSV
ncbi:FAD synthetase family protein [Priestia megaterium]|uniref:FAD synthase n=1 Tax=Priestia megaterium TaxID=1404 RepID=A0A6H1NYW9_PRIMG|nr:FAD synthetase family protein [Priestia megaterium]QIZ06489.1 FAD synthetase family protein [Priestia megaterium]